MQQEIEKTQLFVAAVEQFVQTDFYEFDLGEERRVVIVADGVRMGED